MSTFELKVITPDVVMFDGEAESIFAKTVMGDVLILPRHISHCHSVFWKTAAAIPRTGVQKAVANTVIQPHALRNFADIGSRFFAKQPCRPCGYVFFRAYTLAVGNNTAAFFNIHGIA